MVRASAPDAEASAALGFAKMAPSAINPASNLSTTLAGIELRNPMILAAGTCGVLDEMSDVLDLSRVGALVTKSITREPREGNNTWRVIPARGGAGMLNAIGLANPGLDAFLSVYAPRASSVPCRVFPSVAGFSIDDYVVAAANIDEFSTSHEGCFPAIELNVSCPNVRTGTEFGHSAALIRELLGGVRPVVKGAKLLVKLGPMTPDFVGVALAALRAGADGLTIANTIPAMAIDVVSRRPRLANVTGGLSGPAAHPVAVKLVWDVRRAAKAQGLSPAIIGLGGVMNWEDAAEFVLAGADAVALGTALFADPRCPYRIGRGLERWVRAQGRSSIGELVGAVELG